MLYSVEGSTSVSDNSPASIFRVQKWEDGGSWTLQNIGVHLPNCAMSNLRRL